MKDAPNDAQKGTRTTSETPALSDDPQTLAREAREGIEKSAAELRKQRIAIATEPPTVFRP